MNMELLSQIFEVCVIPLLGVLTKYLVDFLNAKRDEAKANTENAVASKYLDMVYDTVADCVQATNQTYVESLKASGSFDAEAQKEAFNQTLTAVTTILTAEAKEYLSTITDDVQTYLTQLIEAEVNGNKAG